MVFRGCLHEFKAEAKQLLVACDLIVDKQRTDLEYGTSFIVFCNYLGVFDDTFDVYKRYRLRIRNNLPMVADCFVMLKSSENKLTDIINNTSLKQPYTIMQINLSEEDPAIISRSEIYSDTMFKIVSNVIEKANESSQSTMFNEVYLCGYDKAEIDNQSSVITGSKQYLPEYFDDRIEYYTQKIIR